MKKKKPVIIFVAVIVAVIASVIMATDLYYSHEKKVATEIYTEYAQKEYGDSYDIDIYYDAAYSAYGAIVVNHKTNKESRLWVDEDGIVRSETYSN